MDVGCDCPAEPRWATHCRCNQVGVPYHDTVIFMFVFFTTALDCIGVVVLIPNSGTFRYADNILKTFAASLAIVSSTLLSKLLFDDIVLSQYFMLGSTMVIAATFLYSSWVDPNAKPSPPQQPAAQSKEDQEQQWRDQLQRTIAEAGKTDSSPVATSPEGSVRIHLSPPSSPRSPVSPRLPSSPTPRGFASLSA
jgi:hypothetical protein